MKVKTLLLSLFISIGFVVGCNDESPGHSQGAQAQTTQPNAQQPRALAPVSAKKGICQVVNSAKSNFEIVCPGAIKTVKHSFFSGGKGLNLSGNINGKQMDLLIEVTKVNAVSGRTTNSDIDVTLVLADGREETIHIE